MTTKKIKRGIAMIELIFALVIMGIVLLSAPMLIQQSIRSSNIALQQEAIAAIASHTGILLSKHWDEGDTNLSVGVAPIISLNNPVDNTFFQLAGIRFDNNVSGRTSTVAEQNITASVIGQDAGDFDDIDDYHASDINLSVFNSEESTTKSLGDYVDTKIRIRTEVTYANDRPTGILTPTTNAANNLFTTPSLAGGRDSNIKFVKTTLTTDSTVEELNKTIVLRAFSCNLGTYSLGGKQY
ncbi:MAG: Unknown protein [uncultured Sulfurovum sp.]|uniref:Type II secretion system protein n=1 Tax=uncultured Sulfurovum sp. TaxID=269237 RepID=A0A6S6TQH4_9BACT|nr:MAG: Unknown protein [uncultured Sulfurovum sp.]